MKKRYYISPDFKINVVENTRILAGSTSIQASDSDSRVTNLEFDVKGSEAKVENSDDVL